MTSRSEEVCSGKNCKKSPTKLLKIKYVGKAGRFCEVCAADLLYSSLVEEERDRGFEQL